MPRRRREITQSPSCGQTRLAIKQRDNPLGSIYVGPSRHRRRSPALASSGIEANFRFGRQGRRRLYQAKLLFEREADRAAQAIRLEGEFGRAAEILPQPLRQQQRAEAPPALAHRSGGR